MTTFSTDPTRLQAVLGAPELTRLLAALQKRLARGRSLTGRLTLADATAGEREAIDSLIGRNSTQGASLQIDLDLLEHTLREAGVCPSLVVAVERLVGPVVDQRALAEKRKAEWSAVWNAANAQIDAHPPLKPWLVKLKNLGLLQRLSGDRPAEGAALLRDVFKVAAALPARAEPLASFAARLFGDAHALDAGAVRATLSVRAAAKLGGIQFDEDAEGRRAAWASVGVMCDELSTPALVFNLNSTMDTPLGRLLRQGVDDAVPLHVTLHLLLRHSLAADPWFAGRDIFVCENPTIVALAAGQIGRPCAPLICVNGQFATPSLVLLRQLRDAGARLHYHGDFDPAGLIIARRVIAESGAQPWRFGSVDYIAAPKGLRFDAKPVATPWDEALGKAMRSEGRAVHEEAVFNALALDLARASPPGRFRKQECSLRRITE